MAKKKNKDYVYFFDTTLRDGEQCPGASMTEDEKLAVAHQLATMKIDIIEAGFPVSSPLQFAAVERISREINGPVIAALARAVRGDIESAHKALLPAKKKRIHTFIATSEIHMKHKLGKKPSEVLKMAVNAVKIAKDLTEDVEFSAEDATRSDLIFLTELVSAVIEAGATTINIPDTVGYTTSKEYAVFFDTLTEKVNRIEEVILSAHCHNDLGLATSNSLIALQHGARQIESTINGIGERAGNTAMEEVIMAIETRPEMYPYKIGVNPKQITKTSRLVSHVSGLPVQPNKAIVGANAFAHESGIHQDGVIKNRLTYEIMTPESVGLEGSRLVLGRHSGRAGFNQKVKELGYKLNKDESEKAYQKFLDLADRKKELYEEDIAALLQDEFLDSSDDTYKLDYFHTTSGSTMIPTATIRVINMKKGTKEEAHEGAETGDGPVSALFRAIEKATGIHTRLEHYNITPISIGKDALGEARVGLKIDDIVYYGKGTSTDIVEASAKAFLDAVNKSLSTVKRKVKDGI